MVPGAGHRWARLLLALALVLVLGAIAIMSLRNCSGPEKSGVADRPSPRDVAEETDEPSPTDRVYVVDLVTRTVRLIHPQEEPATDGGPPSHPAVQTGKEPEPPAAHKQDTIQPKIVPQLRATDIDVAAWTADDHYVVSASGKSREVIIWDAWRGMIVDRLTLPLADAGEKILLGSLNIAPDGRTATIKGEAYTLFPDDPRSDDYWRWDSALYEAHFDDATDPRRAEAEALLPKLPRSHDSKESLARSPVGLAIISAHGPLPFISHQPLSVDDAGLSPNGRFIAVMQSLSAAEDAGASTIVDIFDTISGRYGKQVSVHGRYGRLRWTSDSTFLLTPRSDASLAKSTRLEDQGPPPPAVTVDANNGNVAETVPARCYLTPLPGGGYVGAGLANCRANAGADLGLERFDATTREWHELATFALPRDASIVGLAAAPTGERLAVVSRELDGTHTVAVVDAASGTVLHSMNGGEDTVAFSPDGETLFVTGRGIVASWVPETDELVEVPSPLIAHSMIASDGRTLLSGSYVDEVVERFDPVDLSRRPPLDFSGVVSGGFLPGRPVFWAASTELGVRLWDTRDWSVLLTTHFFAGQRFLTVAPDGRYDTNLGPDASQFRWLMPDAPFQSLAPQTFMRDFFEPRIAQRLLDCTTAGNCESALKPLPAMADLNRVLPEVRITSVREGKTPAEVVITVEAEGGSDPAAPNGKTRSGVYNIRLFRNDRFVEQFPDVPADTVMQDLAEWRRVNQHKLSDGNGIYRREFTVTVPTGPGTEEQEFSAYAFNSDRVKSDTATFSYVRPPARAQQARPRAYVVTIGIDAYDEPRLKLQFAAADARLLGERLASIPGHEVRHVSLLGTRAADGKTLRVTREMVDTTLGLLAGDKPAESIAKLGAMGVDASQLGKSTPDDVVIISFAGHGWADKQGNFYLVPADGSWPGGAETPTVSTLISSAEITRWLRPIDAADIALIIDACHSAASVDAGGFKPGPMGDAGLGQLAYDKGIRILAATQADDVALEDARLRQGLLTFALAGEGITAEVAWPISMATAASRSTTGCATPRSGCRRSAGTCGWVVSRRPRRARAVSVASTKPATKPPRLQEPSLFDFTGAPSTVVLRTGVAPGAPQ